MTALDPAEIFRAEAAELLACLEADAARPGRPARGPGPDRNTASRALPRSRDRAPCSASSRSPPSPTTSRPPSTASGRGEVPVGPETSSNVSLSAKDYIRGLIEEPEAGAPIHRRGHPGRARAAPRRHRRPHRRRQRHNCHGRRRPRGRPAPAAGAGRGVQPAGTAGGSASPSPGRPAQRHQPARAPRRAARPRHLHGRAAPRRPARTPRPRSREPRPRLGTSPCAGPRPARRSRTCSCSCATRWS